MNITPQSGFLRTLTSWITVFSYSAACDWAYNEMALNNVMPLYPRHTYRTSFTPQWKHEEGSVGSRGKGLRILAVVLRPMSHVTFDKVTSQLLCSLPYQSIMRVWTKSELLWIFPISNSIQQTFTEFILCCHHCARQLPAVKFIFYSIENQSQVIFMQFLAQNHWTGSHKPQVLLTALSLNICVIFTKLHQPSGF